VIGVPRLIRTLAHLRAGFLEYIERRYGAADRAALDTEIEEALADRIAYWLYRSIQYRHWGACRDLLSIAGARRETVTVGGKVLSRVGLAVGRRLTGKSSSRTERQS
jgi:hypothetical protein